MSTPKMIGAHVPAGLSPTKNSKRGGLYSFGQQFNKAFETNFCAKRPHLRSRKDFKMPVQRTSP